MLRNCPHRLLTPIALLVVAGPVHAVDFEVGEGTLLSIYGTLEPKVINETDSDGDDSLELDDEDSTLGFRAEHRLNDELTAFGQIEVEFSTDDPAGAGGGAFDEQDSAFLGLKGGFGKVKVGNFDNVYEELIIDATEVAEDAEISDEGVASEDNMIAYYSPDFGGFSFRAQTRVIGENDDDAPDQNPDNEVGFAIAGGYTADAWGVYAGYDDRGAEAVDQFDNNGDRIENSAGNAITTSADEGTFGVAAIGRIANVELAGKFAQQDLEDNDPRGDDITFSAVRGTVGLGRTELYGAVQTVDEDNGADRDELTLGVKYPIWDNLLIWAEAGEFDRTNDAGDNAMVGAIFSF